MTRITLQADSLISTLPDLLPVASPVLLDQQEAIAALIHTIHTTIAFELTGVDEVSDPIQQLPMYFLLAGTPVPQTLPSSIATQRAPLPLSPSKS